MLPRAWSHHNFSLAKLIIFRLTCPFPNENVAISLIVRKTLFMFHSMNFSKALTNDMFLFVIIMVVHVVIFKSDKSP